MPISGNRKARSARPGMVWSTSDSPDHRRRGRRPRDQEPQRYRRRDGRRQRHTRQYQVTRRETNQLAPARPEIVAQTGRRRTPSRLTRAAGIAAERGQAKFGQRVPRNDGGSLAVDFDALVPSSHAEDVDASAQLGKGGHGIGLLARQGLANQGGRIVGWEEATIVFEYGDGVAAEQAISGIGIDDVHRACHQGLILHARRQRVHALWGGYRMPPAGPAARPAGR